MEPDLPSYKRRSTWGKFLDGLPWIIAGLLVGTFITWLLGGF